MAYQVVLSRNAKRDLDKASHKTREKIVSVFDMLQDDPYVGKKLKGEYAGTWAIRAWPYRIMYQILETKLLVHVVRIRHRKDAYR